MTHNLLKGKRGIIFGALNEESIAWKVAVKAVEEGASITLSNTAMALRMGTLDQLSKQLNAPVIAADATSVEDLEKVFAESVQLLGGKIDFVLHSIGMSPNVRKHRTYDDLDYNYLQKTRHFCHLFPQDVAGCQEAGCHCRVWFSGCPHLCCSSAYVLRLQRYGRR